MIITSSGDSGDCCYLLCVAKFIKGAPHSLLIEEKSAATASGKSRESAERLMNFIKPLMEAQPYIKECRMIRPDDVPQWRSGDFRIAGTHERTPTLLLAHLTHHNLVTKTNLRINSHDAWLTVPPSDEAKGMVVINRTARYLNRHFQWAKIVEHYGSRIVFVGLLHEWERFCEEFGPVSFRETNTLLDVTRLISSSELFIGNQSCPYACAEGMKHPSIQEVSLAVPDCVFPRPNAQFVADGSCKLPDVSGSGEITLSSATFSPNYKTQTSLQPKYGWSCKGFSAPTHKTLQSLLCKELGLTKEESHKAIIDELWQREPGYFGPNHEEMELYMVREAISGGDGWRKGHQKRLETELK